MPYEIVKCKVDSVDSEKKSVRLTPLDPTFFETIDVGTGTGLKFASDYSPYIRVTDPKNKKIFNTPTGFVNYPQENDIVLALIWVTDISKPDRLRPKVVQNANMEVIIFAKVNWDFPDISTHDNILLDRSGAKLHFNHGWLDLDNLIEDEETDKRFHALTGHTTLLGNRTVRIAGQKFLPFGLYSHKLGKEGKGRAQARIMEEDGEVGWNEAFTQDPTDTSLFDGFPHKLKRGSKKFLEPPCPPPSTLMDIHESGYKNLVEQSGHVRKYIPKGEIEIIGHNNNDMPKMAFDPVGQDENSSFPAVATGVKEFHLKGGNKTVKIEMDAPNDKIVFTMDGGLVFTINGADNKITISAGGGFEFTGNLKVTGTIESTVKVITPAVGSS